MKKFWLVAFFAVCFAQSVWAAAAAPTLTIGKPDAPITIDEYASLGCPHCADFMLNTLPALKKVYIDTGKVKIIFHHFPLDLASMDGALLIQCLPTAKAQEDALNLLYFQQDKWARDPDYDNKLVGYGQMLGLTEPAVHDCFSNAAWRNAILQSRIDASKNHGVSGTPTFIFNHGKAMAVGFQTYDQMVAILSKL